jgi:hypothetical protein
MIRLHLRDSDSFVVVYRFRRFTQLIAQQFDNLQNLDSGDVSGHITKLQLKYLLGSPL